MVSLLIHGWAPIEYEKKRPSWPSWVAFLFTFVRYNAAGHYGEIITTILIKIGCHYLQIISYSINSICDFKSNCNECTEYQFLNPIPIALISESIFVL